MAIVNGTDAGEILNGTNLADQVFGLGGSDDIAGRDGDDLIEGGAGGDLLDGGYGFDQASYRSSAAGVSVYLGLGYGQGGDAQGDGLYGIEGAIGSAHSDLLVGTEGRNVLRGEGGSDSLLGAGGDDELQGGAGGDGLFGDAGFDTASYRGSTEGVSINLGDLEASDGDAEGDTLYSIEGVVGSAHSDWLFGDDVRNVLRGEGGTDLLFGDGGADLLAGGGGGDHLIGGAGADELRGDDGSDTAWYFPSEQAVRVDLAAGTGLGGEAEGDRLFSVENLLGSAYNDRLAGTTGGNRLEGGTGADELVGRGGADRFIYQRYDSDFTAPDLIRDFSRSQGDKIDLSLVDANEQADGDQGFAFLGQKQFTGVGQLRFFQQDGDTFVEANTTDATGGAELTIKVDPLVSFQATDFLL